MIGDLLAVRKGENVMSTMTGNLWRMMISGGVATVVAFWAVGVARADVTSDQAAAILIFPKIVVDTSGTFVGQPTDTEIQITNASNSVIAARCNLVNATSFCSNSPIDDPIACSPETEASANPRCGSAGVCVPQWTENDFRMTLTKRQPVSWKVSEGLSDFPISNSSAIPKAQTDPFIGELKCVEVDPTTFRPIAGFDPLNNGAGDLKGEATIVSADSSTGKVDARKYNGIGLQATDVNNGDDILNIGGPEAEYSGCPNVLILNHFFDDANITTTGGTTGTVRTDLTVVPCGEDFNLQLPNTVVLQFLVFNEFEQRFSTSTRVTCFREVQLSNIDTRPVSSDDIASIFNINVQGTFAGQTRIRSVSSGDVANAVVAVSEEFWDCTSGPNGVCSTASQVNYQGSREQGDQIILAPDNIPEPF